METTIDDIERLFQQKIETYQALIDICTQERNSLENADVDALWKFSDQKQRLATRIAEIRTGILSCMKDFGIFHDMNNNSFQIPKVIGLVPKPLGRKLQNQYASLISLKMTIQTLSEENKRFVQDYLDILDELIGIITNTGKPEPLYSRRHHSGNNGKTNLFVSREV